MIFNRIAQRAGFTFIEVIISIALFSGIMFLVLMLSLDLSSFAVYFQQDLFAKQELQLTMATMQTELRSATISENGSYALISASPTSVSFFADANGDGFVDQIRYFLSTSTLKKGVVKPTSSPAQYLLASEIVNTVTSNVTTGTFMYYNALYTGTQPALTSTIDITPIRIVKFQMTVDQMTSTRPGPLSASITATIRNLRSTTN